MTAVDLLGEILGNIHHKAGGGVAVGLAVQHTTHRTDDIELLSGTGHRHVAQAAVLLQLHGIEHGLIAGEDAVLKAGQQHHGEFQSLGGVHGHQHHRVGVAVVVINIGHQRLLLQESCQIGKILTCVLFILADGGGQFLQVLHAAGLGVALRLPHSQIAGLFQHIRIQGVQGDIGVFQFPAQVLDHRNKLGDLCRRTAQVGVVGGVFQHLVQGQAQAVGDGGGVLHRGVTDAPLGLVNNTAQAHLVAGVLEQS